MRIIERIIIMIPLLDKTSVRLILILAIISACVGLYKWHYDTIFNAGVNSIKAEMLKEFEANEIKHAEEIKSLLDEKKKWNETATNLQKQLKEKDGVHRNEIEKIKTNFNCIYLGDEFYKMWNKIIGDEPIYVY